MSGFSRSPQTVAVPSDRTTDPLAHNGSLFFTDHTMLYKFKSAAAGDLIMLEPNGRQVLTIIGKNPGPKGIILAEQMPAALDALAKAIADEEAAMQHPSNSDGEEAIEPAPVSLRQRAVPFVDMLKRCSAAGKDIVWGV